MLRTLSLLHAGHTVIAAHRSETADRAMPPWTQVEASVDLVCRLHQRINDVYDVNKIDVVIVGIFHQVSHHSPDWGFLLGGWVVRNVSRLQDTCRSAEEIHPGSFARDCM